MTGYRTEREELKAGRWIQGDTENVESDRLQESYMRIKKNGRQLHRGRRRKKI